MSGARGDRPQLLNLLGALRPDDLVVVAAIDRLARSLKLLLDILERIEQAGATFHSMQEGWDTGNAMGRFALHLVGAVAELERGMIAERERWDVLRNYAGRHHGAAIKAERADGRDVGQRLWNQCAADLSLSIAPRSDRLS